MSHISKCRGADSSPAGNSESPQAGTFIPASKSDENRIVGTSSVAGNKLFQQNCKPSAQMQSQITPQVSKPLRRARKFFQNSNNNNQIAFLAEKDLAGNLETTVPLSRNSIKVEPVANADLTSPITRKGAICQESYPTFTPQQLEQSHRKTRARTSRTHTSFYRPAAKNNGDRSLPLSWSSLGRTGFTLVGRPGRRLFRSPSAARRPCC